MRPSGSGMSTLIKTVKGLERTPQAIPPQRFLSILKELRDDHGPDRAAATSLHAPLRDAGCAMHEATVRA